MNLEIENNNSNNNINSCKFSKELNNYLKNTYYSIDRFEGDFAICENLSNNKIINIKKDLLPPNAKEGDIIKYENNQYIIDIEKTTKKQEEIKCLVNNLFKKKK